MKAFHIGERCIDKASPCYVIAEIGHNHQGSLDMALHMIETAAACGVHAVKFQKRDIKSLYTKAFAEQLYENKNSYGKTYGEHRAFLELKDHELLACKKKAIACGLEFLITPFDEQSALFCYQMGVNAFKLASGDLTNEALLRCIASFKKPMIVSTGASTLSEIKMAHQLLLSLQVDFAFLYAVSSYPTLPDQLNLNRIKTLQQLFPDIHIGYSGHDEGIDGAIYAAASGARVIEKHFTLDKSLKGTDQCFSLNPSEMKMLMDKLRLMESMMGIDYADGTTINSIELDARKKMGKGIYAASNIESGTILTHDHFSFKSPGTPLTPNDAKSIIGKKTLTDLKTDEPIQLHLLTTANIQLQN